MATRLPLFILVALFLVLLVLPISHSYTYNDEETSAEEELFDCFVSCDRKRQGLNPHELTECEQKCVRSFDKRKEEEKHPKGDTSENHHDPIQQYKQCQSRCAIQHAGGEKEEIKRICRQRCQTEYEKQKREASREHGQDEGRVRIPKTKRGEQEQEQETGSNPYFFDSQRFSTYRTEHGHLKLLERFNKRSELFRGLENYRLAVLEADPSTFVVPHHIDAESVFVVVGGKGTISFVWQNQRQSINLKVGDVMRVPAGSLAYWINRDDNERLYVLKMLLPVNTPGKFQGYFGVGGENTESFYQTFSSEILEAAFNAPKERLEKIFGQKQKGLIIKASKEQIRALSQQSESSWGKGRESWKPFNLLNQRPVFASQFGQLFEANPSNFEWIKDLDVSVSFMNITKGGMVAPYYNSMSTKIAFVVGGKGRFEMACPHLASQSKQETRTSIRYQKVSAQLSIGDAFIIPAGHPVSIVASQDSDLKMVAFGTKASFNQKNFLAGKENVWNQVEPAAKELAFNLPAKELEKIFKSQEQSFFLQGPGQKEKGKGSYVAEAMDFVGF